MKKYALVNKDNVVTNIVMYAVDFSFEVPTSHNKVEIAQRGVEVGDSYDPNTGKFSKP